VRAQALYAQGRLAKYQEDFAEADTFLQAGLAIWRALGDARHSAIALYALGYNLQMQGRYVEARACYAECLVLQPDDLDQRAHVHISLGLIAMSLGEFAAAQPLLEESRVEFIALGDQRNTAMALRGLGLLAFKIGDYAASVSLHKESLALFRALADTHGSAVETIALGYAVCAQGDLPQAAVLHLEALENAIPLGDKLDVAECLAGIAAVAAAGDAPEQRRAGTGRPPLGSRRRPGGGHRNAPRNRRCRLL
jgi:tetratricopeptide (TPR) repeat protein